MKTVLFIDNSAHHFYGQLHLAKAFVGNGYTVVVMIPNDNNYFIKLQQMGYLCINIRMDGKSRNLMSNLIVLRLFYKLIKKYKPNLICSFTIKPNIFASIVGAKLNIPVIANVTGLGYVFIQKSILSFFVVKLYKYAFKKLDYVFFQNHDDKDFMLANKIFTDFTKIMVIPGSGVDTKKFLYHGLDAKDSITFLFSGRLLWDKGIFELIEAFKIVKQKYSSARLLVIGNYFLANPSAIKPKEFNKWVDDGIIEYLGMVDDVAVVIRQADCVILPSYREGTPRSLLEACSMGKPIITVDSVGCKEVIEDGINGFIAKTKDINSLMEAMVKFIELPFESKVKMGINGRQKMEQQFEQTIVVNSYIQTALSLL